jgi:polar amino acid transport system substrate-binding protein
MVKEMKFYGKANHLPMDYLVYRLFGAVLCALLLIGIFTACSPLPGTPQAKVEESTGELASIVQNGILIIATDPDYYPQSKLDTSQPRPAGTHCDQSQYTANQFSGFDVEVGIEIARRMNVEPCFVAPTWSQVVSGNWGGRWDIDVESMVITMERMQKLYFTQPYVSGAAAAFVHKDNQTLKTLADLSNKRIGVCAGCAYEAYLHGSLVIPGETITFQIKNATVVGYDTDRSALDDLALGNGLHLDAVLTDPDTGKSAIEAGLPIKQIPGVAYHDYSAVSIDKSSSQDPIPLLKKVTGIIQSMHKDGTLLKLSQKYYHGDFTTPAANFDFQQLVQTP